MTVLSILIPTLKEEYNYLKRLLNILNPQIQKHSGKVELLLDDRGRGTTTGDKRNYLIHQSSGLYTVFIDTDDLVPMFYVDEILKALQSNPDCVTFNGYMTTNGANRKDFVIKLGESYEERDNVYYRWPNHLAPIKREVTSKVKFPHVTYGEDYEWSKRIKDMKLLRTSVHIPLDMYVYDYRTKPKPNRR